MDSHDNCPVCGLKYISQCKCLRSDRTCPQGHHWHQCLIHKNLVGGEADHANNGCSCTTKHSWIPSDATGWDETGWWTRTPIIPLTNFGSLAPMPESSDEEIAAAMRSSRTKRRQAWDASIDYQRALATGNQAQISNAAAAAQQAWWTAQNQFFGQVNFSPARSLANSKSILLVIVVILVMIFWFQRR